MSEELCLVRDGHYGICNLPKGHKGVVHQETLADGSLWAQWRSILPSDEYRRADFYVEPARRRKPPWFGE
jgi:hypothetical protein